MTVISDKYNALGSTTGFLGAATPAEIPNSDGIGVHQGFVSGTIYWHPDFGAYEIR
jgi:uncharacterized protein with LGFP repeats